MAEIEKSKEEALKGLSDYAEGVYDTCEKILSFLDTLEVKEIPKHYNLKLNDVFNEMGIDPDSRIAKMLIRELSAAIGMKLLKIENKDTPK